MTKCRFPHQTQYICYSEINKKAERAENSSACSAFLFAVFQSSFINRSNCFLRRARAIRSNGFKSRIENLSSLGRDVFLFAARGVLRVLPLSDLHLTACPSATQKIVSNRDYFAQMDHVVLLGDMVGAYGTDGEYSHLAQFIRDIGKPYSAGRI